MSTPAHASIAQNRTTGSTLTIPPATEAVTPFEVHVPEPAIVDLRLRLRLARWPDRELVDDWSQGVPLAAAQSLVDHWLNHYDWRRFEARLNSYPQFRTRIDGVGIYFIHARSPTRMPCRFC